MGKEVITLINGIENAGLKNVMWDSKDKNGLPVSAGIYFYELKTKNNLETRKMLLIR